MTAQPHTATMGFPPPSVTVEHKPDGTLILRSGLPLPAWEKSISVYLRRWAEQRPDQVWLARREGPDRKWREVSYAEGQRIVDGLTQALLDRDDGRKRPLMILSSNSFEHAFITMAATAARIPVAPISPAYSLASNDHGKLRYVFDQVKPGFVFVQDAPHFRAALNALPLDDVQVIYVDGTPTDGIAYADLLATQPTPAVQASIDAIEPDTIAKILFTSGSTGKPKGVANTHKMLCSNLTMMETARPRSPLSPPPVTLSWLPWSHTMGGVSIFLRFLADGGALYLDDGSPVAGGISETLQNLREVPLTYYTNVPFAYSVMVAAMETEEELGRTFFQRLEMLAYGGASLSADLYDRLQAQSLRFTGRRIFFTTAWGATEMGPSACTIHWPTERRGLIGLPLPGFELKMLPYEGAKYELRVRSPSIMSGYYNMPELDATTFDDEGFYNTGDTATFADPYNPAEGLVFGGRMAEDFKLNTGTFVQPGAVRVAALGAVAPLLTDAVVAGENQEYLALLAWPNLNACRQVMNAPDATVDQVVRSPAVHDALATALKANRDKSRGSSQQIKRILLMTEPASIDANETTDKGYVNQRATLKRRAALVERLYQNPPTEDVVVIG